MGYMAIGLIKRKEYFHTNNGDHNLRDTFQGLILIIFHVNIDITRLWVMRL